MFYVVYKTLCIPTGQFYYGVHKTNRVDDGYLGEGKRLLELLAVMDQREFKAEVIGVYTHSQRLIAYGQEARLISASASDPLCLNIQSGESGFDRINARGLNTASGQYKKANKALHEKCRTDPEFDKQRRLAISKGTRASAEFQAAHAKRRGKPQPGSGNFGPRSAEQIEKYKATCAKRRRKSGWKWMNHPEHGSKVVLRDEIREYRKAGWKFGRKKKNGT
jgi:hypothetical protein